MLGYCVGSCTNVFQRLKRGFTETEVVAILVQVLEGLVYLHSHRIVHRDLKSGNLLLMEDGTASVADFGVSSQLATAESRCHTFVGSPYWIAPEVRVVRVSYECRTPTFNVCFSIHVSLSFEVYTSNRFG